MIISFSMLFRLLRNTARCHPYPTSTLSGNPTGFTMEIYMEFVHYSHAHCHHADSSHIISYLCDCNSFLNWSCLHPDFPIKMSVG